ncbi:hypothetical protein [Allopontixanthobacter sediminis]|uniref:Uncharacterized protein n=1 Tax=Allopontixanthobacter sediminis TaxID=1689985 RepID=A0A845BD87_9SPHN|nr:hypothetical protein [Allopontixanthobacter sediminis]MXP45529.1 hypothetical protein [Allopontixanthobacter sediminis]
MMGKAGKGCGCFVALLLIALIANSREFGWIFGLIGTAFLAVWAIVAGIAHDLTAPSQPGEGPAEIVASYASFEPIVVQALNYRLVMLEKSGGLAWNISNSPRAELTV